VKEENDQFACRAATVGDVDGVFRLVNRMAESGQMLRRSKYRIVTMLTNFMVAESQGGELSG
jgi:N-acetylglutamate synthase-like GNAT family acetyltransferase